MKKNKRGLSGWQLTMLAMGSVIGGTFFLGIAVAIHAAGPSIIISYIIGGLLVYLILYALSEMIVANPSSGSFYTFTSQAYGPGSGFVVGWVYWTGKVLTMTSEATAAAILMRQWYPRLSVPLIGGIIIILVTLLNLLGASKLGRLESSLSVIKLLATTAFIVLALLLITGVLRNTAAGAIGIGALSQEPFMPSGFKGMLGSMLIVILAYSGFEVIGLAASETENPTKTIPRVITVTVILLISLYILTAVALLPLIPTAELNDKISPMVAALGRRGIGWASMGINFILVTAILSTMLASMFGLGRMMRTLARDGNAPAFLKEHKEVPRRGIMFSGLAMLLGMGLGLLFPSLYLFLISAGGFASLFTYASIMATHIRFRKCNGCPPDGKCQMPGYPYTSWIALISTIVIIISMPFISGQASGLIAGIIMLVLFAGIYYVMKITGYTRKIGDEDLHSKYRARLSEEFSEELTDNPKKKNTNDKDTTCDKNK
jgi:L-asparagine transporter-like permease